MEATAATAWVIDPMHSQVQFKVKHLMVSTVTGSFTKFEGQVIAIGDDFADAQVTFSADIDGISTGQPDRDGHLKSADFFDAAQFPKLSFVSTSMTKTGDDVYALLGNLTLHGETKPVSLKAEFGGQAKDGYGNHRTGFEVTGIISRNEFGLTWNGLTEAGGVILSDDIKLAASIQVIKQ